MAMSVGNKGKPSTIAEINITPFTDVCLVLLIIFMVSASFMGGARGLDIKMPAPSTNAKQDNRPTRQVSVTIDPKDVITIQTSTGSGVVSSHPLTFAQLIPALSSEATRYKVSSVTVKPTTGVVYSKVIRVMDCVKQAGITDLALTAPVRL